jgi:hypothetical protein
MLGGMSALAHISRASSALFGLLALFCFALPFLNALARSYEGGAMLITCFLLGGFLAVVSAVHYGCYRYARMERGSPAIRAFVWCVVVVSLLAFSGLVTRIFWLTLHPSHATA